MATEGSADSRTDPVVTLTDVHKVYHHVEPVPALDNVTLSIPRGSYTAVMGPSGSGKSTLMNLVGCLDSPTAGSIAIDGEEVTGLGDDALAVIRRHEIGFVFQTFNLVGTLTAAENVALPMVFAEVPRAKRRERAGTLLESVGLADRADHVPGQLSGGQRQRVSVARALANEPTILLADEPTGSLDTETGSRILGLFAELNDRGNTVIVITHERHVAEHADRIVHLLDGTVEYVETVEKPRGGDEQRADDEPREGDEPREDGDPREDDAFDSVDAEGPWTP